MFNSSDMYQLVHATRGCLSDMYIISKTLVNIYPWPRSLANGTGEIVLPNKDNEIGGSLLISCGEPTTTNFALSGFISRAFVAHHHL